VAILGALTIALVIGVYALTVGVLMPAETWREYRSPDHPRWPKPGGGELIRLHHHCCHLT
jgi:hypothetical protein